MQKIITIIVGTVILLLVGFLIYRFSIQPQLPSDSAELPTDTVITLQRTQCFGPCPAYSLTIYGDGRVVYTGEQFVETKGTRTMQLPVVSVKELVDEFYRADYFSMKDEYTADVADMPTTTTSITINGKTKKVINYYGAPEQLSALENQIDQITNSKVWIGKCDFETCR